MERRDGGALPRRHVLRPRLLDELREGPAAVILAGGGYGKTRLGLELAHTLGLASVTVTLAPADATPSAFISRLVAALRRARLTDAAAAVEDARGDPAAAIEALSGALEREREPVLLAVDDVHHADADAAALLAALAARPAATQRLLVLGRHAPASLGVLRAGDAVRLSARELAFTAGEVLALAEAHGVALGPADAHALWQATAGWPAALGLAAERLGRAAEPERELTAIVSRQRTLRYLVLRQLEELDAPTRATVVQLAHLPLLSPAVASAVSGEATLLERLGANGLPFGLRPDGWWELPGPVQELLASLEPLRPATARAAAPVYAQAGELTDALHLLIRAGEPDAAASLVAGISSQEADDLGFLELQTLIDAVPPEVVDRHPRLLLHLARTCEPAAQVRLRTEALDRARTLAAGAGDEALGRAVEAEAIRDLVRHGRAAEAEALAAPLLAGAGAAEVETRARLLEAAGWAAAYQRTDESLARGERLLTEALAVCERLGQRSWTSQVALPLGYGVHFARGRHEQALQVIGEALERLPARSRHRGVILSFVADVLVDCGRYEEAEAVIGEERSLGALLADNRICAYAAWSAAKLASQAGDGERLVRELRTVEAHRDDWFDHWPGVDFMADAADLLDRVGEAELALDYLERARRRRDELPFEVALAELAVLARSGDPEEAELAHGRVVQMPRVPPRERWRVALLRACAALRRGDPEAGTFAAMAFEDAAALGRPELPLVRERELTERLVGLAAVAGSRAAAALADARRPLTVRVLGGFELRRAGELLPLPPGKPEQLVKLLAIAGGRLPAEVVIEELWPEVDPASGRKRLRNALNRLHGVAPEIVVRSGELLDLGEVEVDAALFEQAAQRVLERGSSRSGRRVDLGAARLAIARYRGPLLPENRYEPWAAAARERLERRFVSLVDAAADAADEAGDLDDALRQLERALEIDPYDEERYLRSARLLLEQGRRGAAAAMLARAQRAMERLGVPVSPSHRALASSCGPEPRLGARPWDARGTSHS